MHRQWHQPGVLEATEGAVGHEEEHGGGRGVLRVWRAADALVCEVRDAGVVADPLVGRRGQAGLAEGGRGVWMANRLCDLVQLRTSPAGTSVRVHTRLR